MRRLGNLHIVHLRQPAYGLVEHVGVRWHLADRLKYRLDVVHGLEKAPAAVNRLFDGSNTGKVVVRVSEE